MMKMTMMMLKKMTMMRKTKKKIVCQIHSLQFFCWSSMVLKSEVVVEEDSEIYSKRSPKVISHEVRVCNPYNHHCYLSSASKH